MNKAASPDFRVTGSGSVSESVEFNTIPPLCSAQANVNTFTFHIDQVASPDYATGQVILGPVSFSGNAVPSSSSGQCPMVSFSHVFPGGPFQGGAMAIDVGTPATAYVPLPNDMGGGLSPVSVPIDTNGGPPFTLVFSSSEGVSTSGGKAGCHLSQTGDTVPGPEVVPPKCTYSIFKSLQASNTFKGHFELSDWPCLTVGGPAAGHGTYTCKATGSMDLTIKVLPVTIQPLISVSPGVVHFPSTAVGSESAPQTVTVTNLSTASVPLVVNGIGVPGQLNSDYSITSPSIPKDCILSSQSTSATICKGDEVIVDPDHSVTFQVAFTPQSSGVLNANLGIVSNAGVVYSVALYGTSL